jgi:membrane protein implicated in regulation of membrane protease activity
MDESFRPLEPEERRILERLSTTRPQGGARFGAFLAFLITLGVLLIVSPASWQVGARSLLPVPVALAVAWVVFRRLRRGERDSGWLERIERDLAGGQASVTRARVTDAVNVEELEDEGSSYYLRLDDGRVLFLSGQYLYDVEEEGRFPSAVVSVVRAPATRIVFDVTCEGAPIQPSSRRPPFTDAEYEGGRVPEDGAVLNVDFATLRASGRRP